MIANFSYEITLQDGTTTKPTKSFLRVKPHLEAEPACVSVKTQNTCQREQKSAKHEIPSQGPTHLVETLTLHIHGALMHVENTNTCEKRFSHYRENKNQEKCHPKRRTLLI